MTGRLRSAPAALAASLCLTAFFCLQIAAHFHDPFPPLPVSLSTSLTQLGDFTGIALGMRRLAADIAWIQTLQYYATPEPNQSDFELDNGIGKYPDFLAHCQKVARIDPYFTYIYYYGAGALGWNLSRMDEAEDLLKEGIQANPKEWRLQQYLAALAYQKNHDANKLTEFLESFIKDPDCPNLLRSLLANLYKKQGRYKASIEVWLMIYKTGDPAYSDRALKSIQSMIPLLGNTVHPPS